MGKIALDLQPKRPAPFHIYGETSSEIPRFKLPPPEYIGIPPSHAFGSSDAHAVSLFFWGRRPYDYVVYHGECPYRFFRSACDIQIIEDVLTFFTPQYIRPWLPLGLMDGTRAICWIGYTSQIDASGEYAKMSIGDYQELLANLRRAHEDGQRPDDIGYLREY